MPRVLEWRAKVAPERHQRFETDILGYLHDSTPTTRTRLFFTADPPIKLGLTDHWD